MTLAPSDPRARSLWARATIALGLVLVAAPAVSFIARSPRFGGYDTYYFLLYANDLAHSARETSFARYSYFPGSYAFWRLVAIAAGRNFAAYQHVFAGVGLANAALTGLIVAAAGGGMLLASFSFCGYLIFGQRLELGEMTTEPLASLAALVGVLAWLALKRRGRERLGLACLGAGYGLAVFSKQQGAFLAIGAVGLAPFFWDSARPWLTGLLDAVTAPVTALAMFAVAMAADGGGVAAVRRGIATAVDYESHGSLLTHVMETAQKSPALFAALAVAVGLCPAAIVVSWRRPNSNLPALLPVWSLGAATALATLFQFTKRGYAHYALLTVPFALIAIAMSIRWSLRAAGSPRSLARLGLAGVVLAASLLGLEARALPRTYSPAIAPLHLAYASMCDGIQPGDRLLLLPSRQNALHWACGTNARGTRWGYTFGNQERPDEYIEELDKRDLSQVFVFKADAEHPYELNVAQGHDWSGFFTALTARGFQPVARNAAGTLYRRAAQESAVKETGHAGS